jgi:hypothetical protein
MEKTPASAAAAGTPDAPDRKPYHPPTLTLYGSIRQLTRSAGSKNGDGGQNRRP